MLLRSLPVLGTVSLLLTLAACTGQPAADTSGSTAETPSETPKADPLGDMDPDKLKEGAASGDDDARRFTIVPSPRETQEAMESAGIDTKLATLITKRDMQFDDQDTDDVAVRTGVVIADMLLTVKTADNEQLVQRLEHIQTGMKTLKGGDDIDKTIKDIIDRVKADAVTRDDLLKELDELSGAVIPELEFEGQKRVVPLIQAGSWLEGANLVARAAKEKGKPGSVDGILKRPHVVDYFIEYVKGEGKDKAPAAVTEKLEASLQTLKGLAEKPESLNEQDIDTVIKVTEDVLALL